MKKGFTLIELAIVIVIVGLVVSGVIAGQELVKQAELQKTIREIKNFNLSWNTFKLKYNGIPGDLTDPERFFPECNNSVGGDGLTVYEGNGDGMLINNSTWKDSTCVWMHMFNSGLYLPKGPRAEQFFTNSPAEDVDFSTEAHLRALLPIKGEMFAAVEYSSTIYNKNILIMQKHRNLNFSALNLCTS